MKSSYQVFRVHLIFTLNVKCPNTRNLLPIFHVPVILVFVTEDANNVKISSTQIIGILK